MRFPACQDFEASDAEEEDGACEADDEMVEEDSAATPRKARAKLTPVQQEAEALADEVCWPAMLNCDVPIVTADHAFDPPRVMHAGVHNPRGYGRRHEISSPC